MDNRVFNVNGSGDEMLKKTLELAFLQEGENTTCKAWVETVDDGLILLWYTESNKESNKLPAPMTSEDCFFIVKRWLDGEFAKTVKLSDWCGDCDHDGHNSMGWQVYCGGWGHVADWTAAICGIKPAYMWYGK